MDQIKEGIADSQKWFWCRFPNEKYKFYKEKVKLALTGSIVENRFADSLEFNLHYCHASSLFDESLIVPIWVFSENCHRQPADSRAIMLFVFHRCKVRLVCLSLGVVFNLAIAGKPPTYEKKTLISPLAIQLICYWRTRCRYLSLLVLVFWFYLLLSFWPMSLLVCRGNFPLICTV